ncbi:MAG TPA: DivIVA domain-containing protein [Gemmatimonadaceae bacterium]|nr:DivIVA domain-containing protein [Gemmatimonadaceae bacterium]
MDETFHLTALDVRRYDFGRTLRGYDPERVEQFRVQVAEELERLNRQAQELEAKAKGFHEQLRAFRERDKALNDALVSAQQLRGEIREQSEREAQLILREARGEAERYLEGSRNEIRHLHAHIAELERARRNYLAQLRVMAERQLGDITAAEQIPAPAVPAPPPGVLIPSDGRAAPAGHAAQE